MEPDQARDQLEVVDRILARSSRELWPGAEFFIVWGLISAANNLAFQLVIDRRASPGWLWCVPAFLAAGIAFNIWRRRYYDVAAERWSWMQREYLNVLWLTLGVALVAQLAGFRLFPGWGQSALWNVAAAIVLFLIGIHGNPRAVVCGAIAIVSLAIANFMPAIAGYVLGSGMLLAFAGFGVSEMLARRA